jgi:hypothetical protein
MEIVTSPTQPVEWSTNGSTPVVSNATNSDNATGKTGVCSWCGHLVTQAASVAKSSVVSATTIVLNFTAAAAEDSSTLSCILRKLDRHLLAMIGEIRRSPAEYFKRFTTSIRAAAGVIDFTQVAVDIDYFVQRKFKKESYSAITGKGMLTISDIGYACLWLEEMGVKAFKNAAVAIGQMRIFSFVPAITSSIPVLHNMPQLQKAATAIGNVRVFSVIGQISLQTVAERTLALAYAFLTLDAYQKLLDAIKNKDRVEITSAALETAYLLSELAIDGLVLIGYTSVIGLGAAAATCVALAVASLSYRSFCRQQQPKTV